MPGNAVSEEQPRSARPGQRWETAAHHKNMTCPGNQGHRAPKHQLQQEETKLMQGCCPEEMRGGRAGGLGEKEEEILGRGEKEGE